jgi:hypothetical protein
MIWRILHSLTCCWLNSIWTRWYIVSSYSCSCIDKLDGSMMWSRKLSNVGQSLDGWPKINYLELLRASEGRLSHWSRLHLHSLAPTNPYWARVDYGPFSLCVILKEGLCPSSRDISWWWYIVKSYTACHIHSRHWYLWINLGTLKSRSG